MEIKSKSPLEIRRYRDWHSRYLLAHVAWPASFLLKLKWNFRSERDVVILIDIVDLVICAYLRHILVIVEEPWIEIRFQNALTLLQQLESELVA